MSLGRNISKLRQRKGMTQEKLARKAGISKSYLNGIEAGDYPRVHVKTIARIARVLEVSVDELGY